MGKPYQTVAFYTLGCKLNYSETSRIERLFIKAGYSIVDFNSPADIYIINSCSVTDNADKKARKIVRKALDNSPFAKIIMTGCYAQLNPNEIVKIPGISLVVGTEEKFNIPYHINLMDLDSQSNKVITSNINNVKSFEPSFSFGERTRTYLKIQDGCDYNCSFCTIPLARGKSRSSSIEEVVVMAKKIVSLGSLEIVLSGINIGDFGIDYNETLLKLLIELDQIKGFHRYRISSIEPNLLSDEIITFIANSKKFLPHFHIPLQSGSDEILKLMQRRYKTDLYLNRINLIKEMMPDACIGVDVIVGSPGENKNNFQETYDFIEKLDISYLHVFSYSERSNTKAISIYPKVDSCEILERSKILHLLSDQKKDEFYFGNVGKVKNILIESYNDGFLSGFSDNYIKVKVKGDLDKINSILPVKLSYFDNSIMMGEYL